MCCPQGISERRSFGVTQDKQTQQSYEATSGAQTDRRGVHRKAADGRARAARFNLGENNKRMSQIKDKLKQAIAEQRRRGSEHRLVASNTEIETAFLPVSEAAEELRQELTDVPGLAVVVEPHQVRIELYDKQLWFSYSPQRRRFVGSELTSLWVEGGLHEEHFAWETAEACVEAMIQACARYVSLAEIVTRYGSS